MDFIADLDEIKENIATFDKYLQDPAMQEFAIGLIKEGTCFVAVKKDHKFCFYPSKFVGYKNNSFDFYNRYVKESGKDTIPNISSILKHMPDPSKDMDVEYREFCKELHFTGNEKGSDGQEHKFWVIGM